MSKDDFISDQAIDNIVDFIINNKVYIIIFAILAVSVVALTGCGKEKLETVSFKDDENTKATINLSFAEGSNYTLSTNEEDFRTSRDNAILKGDTFNITIQFDKFWSGENINNLKEERKDNEEYKEVTYNGINGFSYYYAGYDTYKVVLPVSDTVYASLCVYSKDIMSSNQEEVKAAFDSEVVQNILNTVTFSVE